MNKPFTREEVAKAYNEATEQVRATFTDEKTTQTLVDLGKDLQLHIDQSGLLGREAGYLLLGLTNPAEFSSRLKEGGFADIMVNKIVLDLNKKIFIPLRDSLREAAQAPEVSEPEESQETPQSAVPSAGEPLSAPEALINQFEEQQTPSVYAPPPQSPSYPNQANITSYVRPVAEPKKPQTINRIQPQLQPQQATSVRQVPQQTFATQQPQMNQVRPKSEDARYTLPNDRLLEDHEEPHIDIAAPATLAAREQSPVPTPSGNLGQKPVPPTPPVAPKPLVTQYATDPYREPIENDDLQ